MKAPCFSSDRLSTLPPPIIEDILCRLYPIQEAARTCILSREWRYKWANVPKLKFNEYAFEVSTDENQLSILNQTFGGSDLREYPTKRFKFLHVIYQVLLLHQGQIDEFDLIMTADNTCVEIDHILINLSRNHALKKLTLTFLYHVEYKLPSTIFSLHQLTHLHLQRCRLDHQPKFNGFGSLTSLYMDYVNISTKTLLHLLSKCPLLKDLTLYIDVANMIGDDHSMITELFQCLLVIERLILSHWIIQCFAQDRIPKVLPTTLVRLKFFESNLCLIDKYWLPFVVLVIRSSPNLEKLTLTRFAGPSLKKSEIDPLSLEDHSDIWLEHLNELTILDFVCLKHSMEFVKLILARSPMLKKVSIYLNDEVSKDEEILILRTLLRSPRASPLVEIIVERPSDIWWYL